MGDRAINSDKQGMGGRIREILDGWERVRETETETEVV